MKFSMMRQEKGDFNTGDCLIEVTTQADSTAYSKDIDTGNVSCPFKHVKGVKKGFFIY